MISLETSHGYHQLIEILTIFQIVADHLITSSGIRPILHCFAVEAIMEGNTIKVSRNFRMKMIIVVLFLFYDFANTLF